MKKTSTRILLVALLMVSFLMGCSSSADSSSSSSSVSSVTTSTTTESAMDTPGSVTTTVNSDTESSADVDGKFIYTADLSLETTTFEDSITALTDLVSSLEGYAEQSYVENRGSYRYASFTLRLPAQSLETFTAQAGTLCLTVYSSTNVEDISFVYYDTQGRLQTQQIKMERLQALLTQAETMEDLLTIEDAISDTQWEIDNLSGEIKYYDSQVNYATVNLSLQEVGQLSNVEVTPVGFVGRMGNAFTNGIAHFVDGLEDVALFFAYHWLTLLIWGAIITVVVRIVRKKKAAIEKKLKETYPKE